MFTWWHFSQNADPAEFVLQRQTNTSWCMKKLSADSRRSRSSYSGRYWDGRDKTGYSSLWHLSAGDTGGVTLQQNIPLPIPPVSLSLSVRPSLSPWRPNPSLLCLASCANSTDTLSQPQETHGAKQNPATSGATLILHVHDGRLCGFYAPTIMGQVLCWGVWR